jgi:hypothetical protein
VKVYELDDIKTAVEASETDIADMSRSGGGVGAAEEIVLEQETEYILEIEEPNVAATTAVIELRWYEED